MLWQKAIGGAAAATPVTPVTVISSSNTFSTGPTDITVNKPANVVVGNLLFAVINANSSSAKSLTAPSGWTVVSTTANRFFAYKTAGSSEPSAYTFTLSGTAAGIACGIVNLSPSNVDVIGTTSAAGSNPVAPSITVTNAKSIVLLAVTANVGSNTVSMGSEWALVYSITSGPAQVVYSRSYDAGATGNISTSTSSTTSRASLVSFAPA